MDPLSAFRYLISHPDLMRTTKESDISKMERLLVLGLSLRASGFFCEVRTQEALFLAPGFTRFRDAIPALFLPSPEGGEICVDADGAEGEEEVLLRHLQAKRVESGPLAFELESAFEWDVSKQLPLASIVDIYPGTQRGETCHRLVDLYTSTLQAHALAHAAEPISTATSHRPRI